MTRIFPISGIIMLLKKKKKKKNTTSSSSQPSRPFLQLSEIEDATNNFDESSLISNGHIWDVYYGVLSDGPAVFKRFHYPLFGPTDSWPNVEKQRLYSLRHPNLVSLIGYCKDDTRYMKETILVYEYVSGRKTLYDHLHELGTHLTWIRRLEICVGVASGLQYLHTAGVMHGDVKSSNILMSENLVPKISDFGLSRIRKVDHPSVIKVPSGAWGYVDRFFIHYGGLTMKSDVYSFGVLLVELLCGRPIVLDGSFDNDDPVECLVTWFQNCVKCSSELADVIDPKVKGEISPKCLHNFFEISKRCMLESTEKRPDMVEVVVSLESILILQKRVKKNPLDCAPGVKELTFEDLEIATRGFSQNPVFGIENAFIGWVKQGTLAPSEEGAGIAVAVVRSIAPHDWLEGVNFLGELDHPNIIKLLGCCSKDGHENLLVYEHMQRSLHHFIHGDDGLEPLSWGTRLNILTGVARGMAYLYTDKGVLCNFQFDDILLDEDFTAKLGGFGWVEVQQRHDRKQLKGVFGYLKADYDPDSGPLPMNDVFSFGLVMLETIAAKHPNDVLVEMEESLEMGAGPKSKSNKRKLKKIMDPRLQGNYSSKGAFSCMALALRCIASQPECRRPSWEEVLWSLEQINALNK